LSQQNLSQLLLHDLAKLVGDQYILCRQDGNQLSYVHELLGILDKQRLPAHKLVKASLLKQSDYTHKLGWLTNLFARPLLALALVLGLGVSA